MKKFLAVILPVAIGVGLFFMLKQPKTQDNYFYTVGKAPEFSFTDENGKTISNKDYMGKPYIVNFFFTSCPSVCPVMSNNLSVISDSIPQMHIASFSIDPNTDTQEVLKEYAQRYNSKENKNWHFMRGEEDKVMELSNVGFNIYAGRSDNAFNGGFEHSGLFALVDENGNIVCRKTEDGRPIIYYKGIEKEGVTALIEDAKRLMGEK